MFLRRVVLVAPWIVLVRGVKRKWSFTEPTEPTSAIIFDLADKLVVRIESVEVSCPNGSNDGIATMIYPIVEIATQLSSPISGLQQ